MHKHGISRRDILAKTCLLTGGFLLFGGQEAKGDEDEGAAIKRAVLKLARTAGAQTDDVRDWLDHSEIVEASKEGDFHSEFANNVQLKSDDPLEFNTQYRVGDVDCDGGVDDDPWLSAGDSEGDLNLQEMQSMSRMAVQIRASTASAVRMSGLPFPLSQRREPNQFDLQYFGMVLINNGRIPQNFVLRYVRPFVMGLRRFDSPISVPKSLMAFGHQPVGDDTLSVVYVMI